MPVRSVGYGVDAELGAGDGVDHLGNGFNVMDGAEDVAGMGAGHEPGPVREQLFEVFWVQFWVLAVLGDPPFQSQVVAFGETYPGGDIGFMVDPGDDELVPGFDF